VWIRIWVVFAVCLLSATGMGQMFPWYLNPKTYESPDRHYRLWVNPDDEWGSGPALYRVQRNRRTVWEGRLPYTMVQALVSNDGTFIGCAYSKGVSLPGDLVVAVHRQNGSPVRVDRFARNYPPVTDVDPLPWCTGMFWQGPGEKAVVRLAESNPWNSGKETWWTYRLADGERKGPTSPDSDHFGDDWHLLSADSLGTYVLVAAYRHQGHWVEVAVLDEDGRSIWRLDLPSDYVSAGTGEDDADSLSKGPVLSSFPDGRFEMRMMKKGVRVRYTLVSSPLSLPGDAAVEVKELSQESYRLPVAKVPPYPFLPEIKPLSIDRIELPVGATGTAAGLTHIAALNFDGKGQIYALDNASGRVHAFSASGKPMFVAEPAAGDVKRKDNEFSSILQISRSGEIWVGYPGEIVVTEVVRFTKDGRRIGRFPLGKASDVKFRLEHPRTGFGCLDWMTLLGWSVPTDLSRQRSIGGQTWIGLTSRIRRWRQTGVWFVFSPGRHMTRVHGIRSASTRLTDVLLAWPAIRRSWGGSYICLAVIGTSFRPPLREWSSWIAKGPWLAVCPIRRTVGSRSTPFPAVLPCSTGRKLSTGTGSLSLEVLCVKSLVCAAANRFISFDIQHGAWLARHRLRRR
jgi:hypothetical protein